MGVKIIHEEQHVEDDCDIKFDATSFFPGIYNLDTNSIRILENGTMTFINGNLCIEERAQDYYCKEIWRKLSEGHEELIDFIDDEVNIVER